MPRHIVPPTSDDLTIIEDRSISLERATLYALLMGLPLVVLQGALYLLFQGRGLTGTRLEVDLNLGIVIAAFIAGVVAHELIHGLAWMLAGGLSLADIKFGFHLKALAPYAHALVPLRARAYRIGGAAPLILVGILPYLLGLALGSGALVAFGMFFTIAAGGDLAVLWLLRGVPPDAWVRDHPSRAGCYVVAGPEQAAAPKRPAA
jgi:hypothetical protein